MNGPHLDPKREFFIAACLVSLGLICLSSCGGDIDADARVQTQRGQTPLEVHDYGNGLVRTRATLPGATARQLVLERVMPSSVRLDQPFSYRIAVLNQGDQVARGVSVLEQLADGFELLHSSLPAEPVLDGGLSARPAEFADLAEFGALEESTYCWRLGSVGPGEQVGFMVTVVPRRLGHGVNAITVRSNDVVETDIEVVSPAVQLDLRLFDREGLAVDHVVPGEAAVLTWRLRNAGNAASDPSILSLELPLGVMPVDETAVSGIDLAIEPIPPRGSLAGTVTLLVDPKAAGVIRLSIPSGAGLGTSSREIPVGPAKPTPQWDRRAPGGDSDRGMPEGEGILIAYPAR